MNIERDIVRPVEFGASRSHVFTLRQGPGKMGGADLKMKNKKTENDGSGYL